MHYVVVYDISNDKLRQKISNILDNFGDRVQRSVFEIPDLDQNLAQRMLTALNKVELESEDTIRIYALCEKCRKEIVTIGIEGAMETPEVYIV